MFKVGQKVVCIWDSWHPHTRACCVYLPVKGEIYTIREFRKAAYNGEMGLVLVEIVNPIFQFIKGPAEPIFDFACFHPIDTTFGEKVCESLEVMTEPELV